MIGWQIKAIAAAVLIAALGGLITVQHFTQKKLNAARHELASANATIEAERKARAHEKEIADAASNSYQAELRRIRSEPDIGPVLLCRKPRNNLSAASTAPIGSDAAASGRVEETTEEYRDVGPQLDEYGTDCEATAAQLTALQGWIRSR